MYLPGGRPAPAAWVTVSVKEKDRERCVRSARTDVEGWFRFTTIEPRPGLRISAAALGREPKLRSHSERVPLGDDIAGGDLLHIDLRLGPWQRKK